VIQGLLEEMHQRYPPLHDGTPADDIPALAGQWLYDVGMPTKSGVGGGVLAVVPGLLGIATYSPPLDSYGNSMRGVAMCNELADRIGLSLFNQYPPNTSTSRRICRGGQRQSRRCRNPAETALLHVHRDSLRIVLVQGVLNLEQVATLPEEPGRLLEMRPPTSPAVAGSSPAPASMSSSRSTPTPPVTCCWPSPPACPAGSAPPTCSSRSWSSPEATRRRRRGLLP